MLYVHIKIYIKKKKREELLKIKTTALRRDAISITSYVQYCPLDALDCTWHILSHVLQFPRMPCNRRTGIALYDCTLVFTCFLSRY
jgi:hypothetical protein